MYYKRGIIGVSLIAFILIVLFAVSSYTEARTPVAIMDPNEFIFRDSQVIYADLDPSSVVYFYITVKNPQDDTNTNFYNVNAALSTDEEVKAEIIIQEGDKYGPLRGMLGYNETIPNATITQRSFGNDKRVQKSYSIALNERAGTWRGMTTIALDKHVYDSLRVRNKLAFDLLIDVDDIPSTRTQFVRLFIKDETKEFPDTMFVDYGLFTQVELVNKTWLKNRGLDYNGSLYKAQNFNFTHSDSLMLETNSLFNEDDFNKVLEIKGDNDHQKLLDMLDSINNESIHINDTIYKFFDIDNYVTWLAVNILFGNFNVATEDFFLYSPSNATRFLFIPWGFSHAFITLESELKNEHIHHFNKGIANFWESPLHRRFLMEEENRDLLTKRIEELKSQFTPEKINNQMNYYWNVISTYSFVMPDLMFLGNTPHQIEEIWGLMSNEIGRNYRYYKDSLVMPTPFRLQEIYIKDGRLYISWNESVSFFRDNVSYTVKVNNDWNFDTPMFEANNVTDLSISLDVPPNAIYYVKIIAYDDLGNSRPASNFTISADGVVLEGVTMFMVRDGNRVVT